MKIEILKDNFFKDYFSAVVETLDEDEDLIRVVNPVGYGRTPIEALEKLVDKLH